MLRDTSAGWQPSYGIVLQHVFSLYSTKAGSVCDPIWPSPSIQGQETLLGSSLQIAAIKGNMG